MRGIIIDSGRSLRLGRLLVLRSNSRRPWAIGVCIVADDMEAIAQGSHWDYRLLPRYQSMFRVKYITSPNTRNSPAVPMRRA